MTHDTAISHSVDMLSYRLDMLYSTIKLYADIADSCPAGNHSLQTTVTDLSRTMDHLASQVQEISGLADAIQKQLYGKEPDSGTDQVS